MVTELKVLGLIKQLIHGVDYSKLTGCSMRSNPDSKDDTRLNLHRLRSIGYIEEAIYWNPDGNFDRVSAGGMLFILTRR